MTRLCDKCGQPLPPEVRRDPPLPPLEHPAVVTIHDLSEEERARVKVVAPAVRDGSAWAGSKWLSTDAVAAREGGDSHG